MLWQARRGLIAPNIAAHSPTATPPDSFIASVVLLLNPTGADASTTFTDASPIARGNATVAGDAQIDTGVTDGGNPTMQFDGTGDSLRFNDSSDWAFGSGSFWIEGRVRFNSTTGQQFLVAQWQSAGNLSFVVSKDASGNLAFNYSTTGSNNTAVTGTWSPSTGTFYDFAVGFSGTKIRLFIDGSMVGSSTVSPTLFDSGQQLAIGANSGSSSFYLNGWMSRIRINKGSDRGIGDGGYTPLAAGHFPTS